MAQRSPQEAADHIERLSRQPQHKVGILDRRLGDRQMKPPNWVKSPFLNFNLMPDSAFKYVGVQDVPLNTVRTVQPTISVEAAKAKINRPAAASPKDLTGVVRHGNEHFTLMGNHRFTADHALGKSTAPMRVWEFAHPPARALPEVPTGKIALAVGIGAASYAAYKMISPAKAEGSTPQPSPSLDASTQALKGMAVATAGQTAAFAALTRAAPKVAASVIPGVGLAMGGLAVLQAGKGAFDGFKSGGLPGAAGGAVTGLTGIKAAGDWTTAHLTPDQAAKYHDANAHYTAHHAMEGPPASMSKRGWANPKVQAAAKAAQGKVYNGPKE
jgi:hypothetical protein